MAFENVFGNVDFGMIPRARQAEAARLQQAIGQGIAQYQQGQDRDLKRRQLENQRPKMQDLDFEIIQRWQAGDRSPEVVNHIQARAAMEGQKTQYAPDPFNPGSLKAVTAPNPFQVLMGNEQVQVPPPQLQQPPRPLPVAPPPQGVVDDIGLVPLDQQGVEAAIGSSQPVPGYEGSLKQTLEVGSASTDTQKQAEQYINKKKIDSFFNQSDMNTASINEQKSYETEVGNLLNGYQDLIEAGGTIETLPDDYTLSDVASNIKSRVLASGAGKVVSGAVGTKGKAAIDSIESVRPIMFGKLRTLLGMTGKELDTKAERDFYLNALTSPETDIQTNLKILRTLSGRFGTGGTVEKINSLLDSLGKKQDIKGKSQEEMLNRYKELLAKEAGN